MDKTIVTKLNLLKYERIAIIHLPEGSNYFNELSHFDTALVDGKKYDLIFTFVTDIDAMKEIISTVISENHLNLNGYLYIAYPKKGNKVYNTFIHRDEIFPSIGVDENGYIDGSNIKFARMVGLDDVFTVVGLKEESKGKGTSSRKVSQRVEDYIEYIPQIEKDLEDDPKQLAFYQSLTSGYRKDWARYVYSAKQEATREKRREEMKRILNEGFKSRDIYLREK
ncbi:hypothetical protein MTP04_38400 [Lysinibacillus sp. PLM2]|nr:hypothetical protein MTP04_38400 [Lysinibacillus sp. PLM2]